MQSELNFPPFIERIYGFYANMTYLSALSSAFTSSILLHIPLLSSEHRSTKMNPDSHFDALMQHGCDINIPDEAVIPGLPSLWVPFSVVIFTSISKDGLHLLIDIPCQIANVHDASCLSHIKLAGNNTVVLVKGVRWARIML